MPTPLDSARTACPAGTVDLGPGRSTMRWEEAPMCPACIATATLVVAGAGWAGWPRSSWRRLRGDGRKRVPIFPRFPRRTRS